MADFADAELADAFGKHRRTIQRWCVAGKLPGAYKAGRSWRIPPGALKRAELPELGKSELERELKGTVLLCGALLQELEEIRRDQRAPTARNWKKVALGLREL
jgi:hypothetical protein